MKKVLIIADDDELFVENLEEYIVRNHSTDFEVRTFTDMFYLEKFFSEPKKVDILLLSPKFKFESMNDQYINNIVFISDDENLNSEYQSIFRFGEITKIYNKLKSLVYSNEHEYETDNLIIDKAKVVTIYSPIGGVGKTSIAVASAIELASQGYKTLYLNLENMQSTKAYFDIKSNSRNLSDIISYLNAGTNKLSSYIQTCINSDLSTNTYYINPADNIFDLEQMSSDDIKYLIQVLVDMKQFNYIVIDTSSTYNAFKKSIIDISNKIILPIEQSNISREKVLSFLNYIDDEELYKFIPVINKYKEEYVDSIKEVCVRYNSFQIQGSINFYEPLQNTSSYIDIFSKYNPFTASIKSLVNY